MFPLCFLEPNGGPQFRQPSPTPHHPGVHSRAVHILTYTHARGLSETINNYTCTLCSHNDNTMSLLL